MMNAKQIGCLFLGGWLTMPTLTDAQTISVGRALRAATTVVQQTTATREEADELLKKARGAMQGGDLKQAAWYLQRVEQMPIVYDGLFQRFGVGDTPAKLRRDLAKRDPSIAAVAPKQAVAAGQQPAGQPFAQQLAGQPLGGQAMARQPGVQQSTPPVANALSAGAGVPTPGYQNTGYPNAYPTPRATLAEPSPMPQGVNASKLVQNPFAGQPNNLSPNSGAARATIAGAPANRQTQAALVEQKNRSLQLLAMSKAALERGQIAQAEQFARQADQLTVPEGAYGPGDMRPWMMLLQIERSKRIQANHVQPATSGLQPAAVAGQVRQAVARPADFVDDAVRPATAEVPIPNEVVEGVNRVAQRATDPFFDDVPLTPAPAATLDAQPLASSSAATSKGYSLLQEGEAAIKQRDFDKARQLFAEAWKFEKELDPDSRQRLQDNLQLNNMRVAQDAGDAERVPTPTLSVAEQNAVRRFRLEVSRQQTAAGRQMRNNPKQAWESLKDLKARVNDAEIPESERRSLVARVDRSLSEVEAFIDRNRVEIERDEQNRSVVAEMDRRRQHKIDVDDDLAQMVDDFNRLMDQERFSEAVVLAKKARELDRSNPVVESMIWKSKFAERLLVEMSLRERSQVGVEGSLTSVIESGVPFDDRLAIEFPEVRSWRDLTDRRLKALRENGRQYSETEVEIQRALRKPVEVDFTNQSLSEVITQLGNLAGVTIYLDPQGLAAEGATTDMPVTLRLQREIALKSALNIILEQFGLTYMVQDEVLKVTSESIRASKVDLVTYQVADLVIPIPNFMPSYDMGLPSAIREAYNAQGFGSGYQGGYNQAPLTVMANNQPGGMVGGQTLAQMGSEMMSSGGASPQPLGFGPGGLGGGANADFDTLIDLITATIAPDSWDDVGGEGSIQGFPTNLSLVVSQTQEVHEQIADLLQQLRRLQDLQVTIEVRFITLNDNFFERIGVDFDFDIDDNVAALPPDDTGPSVTIGLDPQGNPTADLDLSFTQGSFADAVPAFGGFNQSSAASFGFAILSDIEAFFVIEAAQGDTRTNVLQAPKVTLFNGQQANVNDSSQRPFVTSVTPVVGDFAAAQAPIIVVLSEGTSLNVQAVVSNDRRFVRLTLVPFFSRIGDVEEFTFEGSRTTSAGTTILDPTDNTQTIADDAQETTSGTTVQLPQFAFTSVSTTVSVPDGGTILLGGIKRLSEGRNERGVPLLSKFPYVNRLFKNVGIGRTTQSLMMMVTPRIIIQEEEESKLGISASDN